MDLFCCRQDITVFSQIQVCTRKKRNVQYFWWSFQKNAEDFCIILQRGREMMRAKRALQCEMYTKNTSRNCADCLRIKRKAHAGERLFDKKRASYGSFSIKLINQIHFLEK